MMFYMQLSDNYCRLGLINKAYKEKNLVELLKIQLEEEKNQQKNIEEISKGKVGSFNKAFKRQLEELRDNVSAINFVA